jgi:predicted GH43/DUF377 family glycosyl hydrolase
MKAMLEANGSCVIDGHIVKPIRPDAGFVVAEPLESKPGWWAGAPQVYYHEPDNRFYLYYRLRRPRGHEYERGGEVRLASGSDGIHFETIWRMIKTELLSDSIERGCLYRTATGQWALAFGYVDPEDGRWRTDLTLADRPDAFRTQNSQSVFTAARIGMEGVKDPFVFEADGRYLMLLSTARPVASADSGEMHGGRDVYMTGLVRSTTSLAVSNDGVTWRFEGEILAPPDSGWDAYCTRINSVVRVGEGYVGFYDGGRDESENFEERCGVCVSEDCRSWRRLTTERPWVKWPYASGSMRYVSAIQVADKLYYYYEAARADGSHELRVQIEPRP